MKKIDELDKNMPILVIDDFSSVRRVVKNCLAKLGFKNVSEAENGIAALETLAANSFEMVICDWQMPDMSATELMAKIEGNQAPWLMVMSTGQKKPLDEKEKLEYIVKPFTVGTLEEKISKLF